MQNFSYCVCVSSSICEEFLFSLQALLQIYYFINFKFCVIYYLTTAGLLLKSFALVWKCYMGNVTLTRNSQKGLGNIVDCILNLHLAQYNLRK